MLLYCGSSLSDVQITVDGVFFWTCWELVSCIWCNVSKEKTKKKLNDIILMSWDRKVRRIRGRERTVSWLNHKQNKKKVFQLSQIQFLRHSDTLMTAKLWLKCTINTSCETEIDSSPSCAHCDPWHSICLSAAVHYGSCHFRFGSKAPLVSGSPGNFHVFEVKKKLWQHQSKFMRLMGDIARMGGALLCSGMARITWRSR